MNPVVLCVYVIKNKRDTMKTLRLFYLLLCGIMLQGLTCWGYAQSPIPGYDDFPVPIDAAHFPDIHFREYVSQEYDTDSDGAISLEEAGKVLCIDIADRASLSTLKGVKYFFLLDTLDCSSNALTSLDVSSLTALTSLDCSSNVLASLDVSGCTALTSLYCKDNNLTSLDVSSLTALTSLNCHHSGLASLDVSGCTALTSLDCDYNALTSLDVSSLTALTSLDCGYNDLTSLDVSSLTALTSLDCYGNALTSLDVSSLTALTSLNCGYNDLTSLDVSGCTALTTLWCYHNQLTSLDVSQNTALTDLYCYGNALTSLDVSSLTALTSLNCYGNALTSLDVSGCTALTDLDCDDNALTSLDVSGCTALTDLECNGNALTSLDVSGCTALTYLECNYNDLTSLDVSDCTALKYLSCNANNLYSLDLSSNPNMVQVDASWNVRSVRVRSNGEFDLAYLLGLEIDRISSLTGGYLSGTMLNFSEDQVRYEYNTGCGEVEFCLRKLPAVSIDMYNFPDSVFRRYVVENCDWIQDGYLTEEEILSVVRMDVSGMGIHNLQGIEYFTFLESLDCSDNHLTSLDLSSNTRLRDLQADSNCLDVKVDDEKRFYLSELPGFDISKVSGWEGGYVEASILYFEEEMVTYSYVVDNGGFEDVVFMLRADFPVLIPINNETFPDEAFRAYVSEKIDASHDGNLNEGEINSVTWMIVPGRGIRSLQGMEYFTALESLTCSNNELTSLDLSANTNLQVLDAEDNRLNVVLEGNAAFDLSSLPNFDIDRASDWNGAVLDGNMLKFSQQEVTYQYSTAYAGESGDESLKSVLFTLVADRDPSVGNEAIEDQPQGRVYAKDRTIFTEGISGEVSVYAIVGTLVYQGQSNRIPVRQAGIYIVRNNGDTWKLLVR